MHDFKVGKEYDRRKDIHAKYGGAQQGGVTTCKGFPYIFIFKTPGGKQYGYSDSLDNGLNTVYYTGQGRYGDMKFTAFNRAIRDHVKDGKSILLFQQAKRRHPYQYLGEFACTSYEIKEIPGTDNKFRKGIIFHLINIDQTVLLQPEEDTQEDQNTSIKSLREKAIEASGEATKMDAGKGKNYYFYRSQKVKEYVLARANGICECCGQKAPFLRKNGSPYLEPHHITSLSDAGLDHPLHVAALTPNCHREVHHGKDGDLINRKLKKIIAEKEALFEENK